MDLPTVIRLYLSLPLLPFDECMFITDIIIVRAESCIRYKDFSSLSSEFPPKESNEIVYPVIIVTKEKRYRVPFKSWTVIALKVCSFPPEVKLFPLLAKINAEGRVETVLISKPQEECDYMKYFIIHKRMRQWESISKLNIVMKEVLEKSKLHFIDTHIKIQSKNPIFNDVTICLIKVFLKKDCLFPIISDKLEGIYNEIVIKHGGYLISEHKCLICSNGIGNEKVVCPVSKENFPGYIFCDENGCSL